MKSPRIEKLLCEVFREISKTPLSERQLLEEGWKEVVLAIGLLANVGLSNVAKAQARQTLSKAELVKQIEQVVDNSDMLQRVATELENQGYKDAEVKIERNAEKVKGELQKWSPFIKAKTKTATLQSLPQELKRGYALTKVEVDTVWKDVRVIDTPVAIDSFTVSASSDKFFEAGGYTLDSEIKDSLKSIIESIQQQGGTILGVRVESSTDKQRVSDRLQVALEKLGYSSDNKGLSEARNNQVKAVLQQSNIDNSIVQQTILYDQGAGKTGAITPQDSTARYIKIVIDAIKTVKDPKVPFTSKEKQIVYTFELAKTTSWRPSIQLPSFPSLHISKKKCSPTECPVFGK